ncbi:MAG: ABC transporter ATP-binding protein [Rhodobacteraceae bacterium]|nr:ABC transporter ATP-binding protein [Paracoccaceae bacterium]
MSCLTVTDLNAFYGRAQALFNVSIRATKGEIIALIGANGAGKSTFFDSVMGLARATGTVQVAGTDVLGRKPATIVAHGVGYAPERFNLFPYMSVRDTLLVGAYTARGDIERNLGIVHSLFPRLKEREGQEISTQSGGERQMVSLGRALMTSPQVLLVDEPTIGLAPKVCIEIAGVLRRLRDEFGLTIVIAEQNANFALSLAERVYVLESGRVKAEGTAAELSENEAFAEAYFGH